MAASGAGGGDPAGGTWSSVARGGRCADVKPDCGYAGGAWSGVTPGGRCADVKPDGGYAVAASAAAGDSKVDEACEGLAGLEVEDGRRRLEKYDIPVEVSGEGAPAPADGFKDAGLVESVLRNVERCGYESPTPVQRYSMPIVLAGRDLMACAQTGSGKTAAFCLPVVSGLVSAPVGARRRDRAATYDRAAMPRALVLAPTRELAGQISEEAKKFSHETGLRVAVAYGGTPMYNQLRDLEKGVDILVATPGRLVDMVERSKVSLEAIKYLVMDEADRMLDMGFEPQIRKIVDGMGMPRKSMRQTLLFSATFPPEIQRLASDFLSSYIFITVGRVGSSTDLIMQKVEFVSDCEKRDCLLYLLKKQSVDSNNKLEQPLTLVFVETKREADSLRYWLYEKGFPATAIHGDRTQQERESALKSFKTGSTPILVATDVASRGLDVPNVGHVINYDLPKSIDDYVHRIGRTGRAGKAGSATAFFTEANHSLAKGLMKLMTEAKQEVPEKLKVYAAKPCCRGSSVNDGRSRMPCGSSFGGRDYRRGSDNSGRSNYSGGGGSRSYSVGCRRRNSFAAGSSRPNAEPPRSYPSYPMGTSDIRASGWD